MKKRIISAIIMILIATPFIIIGKIPFLIFTTTIAEFALFELLRLRRKIPLFIKIIAHIFVGLFCLNNLLKIPIDILIQLDFVIFLLILLFKNKNNYHYKDAFFLIGITIFIGFAFNNFIVVRNNNLLNFLYLLLIAVATDTFALIIGKKIGKHKLAPNISPNKTIEGLVGGVLVATIIAGLFYIFCIDKSNVIIVIIITIILALFGQLGDLIKSQIKRYENIKDFSSLIPGHGGIIDRLDSLIFITIIYIIINRFI